ncbi:MAG: GntR family transcriptional regulator, partial [Acidobacteria bacterium]
MMLFVKRQPIREVIKEHLVEQIVRGALPAGAPVSLTEIAAKLGVSVTPLREALIDLEAQGFVDSALARGFFVRPLDSAEVREIYPIVGVLEALALEL